jgi:AcrR family transcriptional regulator
MQGVTANQQRIGMSCLTMLRSILTMSSSTKIPKKRPARSSPVSYHHGDLRRALLDAALSIAKREGPFAVGLREVSRRAGVSAAAPYHHFASREAMLAELAVEGFSLLADAMEREHRACTSTDAIDRLEAIGCGYVRFAREYPGHFRLMFLAAAEGWPSEQLGPSSERALQCLKHGVEALVSAGVIAPDEVESMCVFAWSLVHGAGELLAGQALTRNGPLRVPIDQVGRLVTAHLGHGLRAIFQSKIKDKSQMRIRD